MAYSCVRVHFEIGHEASIRNKRTPDGFTHDWEVFVRGADNAEIHHFVEKVVFHLHDTFPKPKRTVKEPPYCVKESGYAGFNLAIDIYFKTREEGSRKLRLYYDLTLQPSGPRISNVVREHSEFTNPPEDFRRKLIKGGGVGIGNDGTSSDKSHNNNMLPSSQGGEDSKGPCNPSKTKPGNPSDLPKKHKPKENSKMDEPRLTNSFADLFGPPIKTGKHSPNPKPQAKTTSESKAHEKQSKEKDSKSVKPSPLKDKDRDKNDKEKDSSSIKKEKDLDKSSTKEKERSKDKEGHREREKLKDKAIKKSASPSVALKESTKKEENAKRPPPVEESTPPPGKDKEKLSGSKMEVKPEKEKKHKEKKNREEREKKDKHKEQEKKEIEKEKVLERIERKPEPPPPKELKEVKIKEKHKLVDKEEKKVKKLEKEKERNHDAEKQKHKHKKKDKHKKDEEKEKTKKKDRNTMEKSPLGRDIVKMKIKSPPSVKKESPPPSPPPPIASKPLNQLILEMSDKDTDSDFSGSGDDDLKPEPIVERAVPPPPPPPPLPQPTLAPAKIKTELKAESYVKEEKQKKKKEKTRDEEREGKKRKKKNKDKEEPPEKQSKTEVKDEHDRSPSPEEETLFTDDYVTQLKDLQHKIMTLQDNADLQRVVQVISETGQFEITQRTFDFDLCALDPSTVKRLQDMFIAASS